MPFVKMVKFSSVQFLYFLLFFEKVFSVNALVFFPYFFFLFAVFFFVFCFHNIGKSPLLHAFAPSTSTSNENILLLLLLFYCWVFSSSFFFWHLHVSSSPLLGSRLKEIKKSPKRQQRE